MIKSSVARSIGAPISQSSQLGLQADGMTPLAVAGETHLILSRADKQLALDALVVVLYMRAHVWASCCVTDGHV